MPIYEYKCPNGHVFERFHGINEPSPEECEVCGAGPVRRFFHVVLPLNRDVSSTGESPFGR